MKGQRCLDLLSISRFQTFFCSTQRFYMFGFRNTSTFASLHDDGAACSSPNSARKLFVDNEFKWREGVNFQADKNRNIWATVSCEYHLWQCHQSRVVSLCEVSWQVWLWFASLLAKLSRLQTLWQLDLNNNERYNHFMVFAYDANINPKSYCTKDGN